MQQMNPCCIIEVKCSFNLMNYVHFFRPAECKSYINIYSSFIKVVICAANSGVTVTLCTSDACLAAWFKTSSFVFALITLGQSNPTSAHFNVFMIIYFIDEKILNESFAGHDYVFHNNKIIKQIKIVSKDT